MKPDNGQFKDDDSFVPLKDYKPAEPIEDILNPIIPVILKFYIIRKKIQK